MAGRGKGIFFNILVFAIFLFNLIPKTVSYKSLILRRVLLPYLGIEFTHFNYSDLAEVGVLKIDPKKVHPVILVDKNLNNRVYANRKDRVIEYADKHRLRLPFKDMGKVRENMPTIEQFIQEYESANPDKQVVIAFPASNVLWNDWFVAYSNGVLFHRLGEPITDRLYSVFLIRRNGTIGIEKVRLKEINGDIRIMDANDNDITEKVAYFTFGQQILKNGNTVDVTEISHQFDDLRHLIAFPEIRTPNRDLDYGGSLFFGQSELLENRGLVNRALRGETIIISDRSIRDNIELYDPETGEKLPTRRCILSYKEIEEMLEKAGYEKVDNPKELVERGQFFYDKNNGKIYIKFKRGLFSHTAIGLTKDGKIIIVSEGALKKDGGLKVEEVAEILKKYGAENGLLLCNGLDVALKLYDQRIFSAEERLWGQRGKFSSVILFVR